MGKSQVFSIDEAHRLKKAEEKKAPRVAYFRGVPGKNGIRYVYDQSYVRRGDGPDAGKKAAEAEDELTPVAAQVGNEPPQVRQRHQLCGLFLERRAALRARSRAWLARSRKGRLSFSQARASW